MDAINRIVEGKIDFRGQRLADRLQQESLVFAAVLAFVVGYFLESLSVALYIFGSIFALVLVMCVPPWSFYNKYDTLWLENRPEDEKKKEK